MNEIHPTAIITGDVRLGVRNTIGPFAVITGPLTIGNGNWIGAGAIIGAPPEVRSWPHSDDSAQPGGITIGNDNVIREGVQIHQGWKATTTIGDRAFIMNQSYVAHDCVVGDDVTLASSVLLAGHVRIGSSSNLGLGTVVHQFRFIGGGAMVGMGSTVTRDIPPFAKAWGSPARLHTANVIGMERIGIPSDDGAALASLYEGGRLGEHDLARFSANDLLAGAFAEWTRFGVNPLG